MTREPGQSHRERGLIKGIAARYQSESLVTGSYLLLVLKGLLLLEVFLLALGDGGILVLLVLGDKVVHVALSLSELHLVHTLTSVPMQESLATEHSSELVADTLEELLDGGGVSNEGGGHLETTGRNGAQGGLDVVGDPLDEVGLVLALDVAHLVLNLLHGDLSAEDSRAGEVTTVTEVRSSHHVLGVEHLLGQLRNGDGTERVGTAAGQRSEANHEEVKTRERNHVDGQLAKIRVELTGETETGGHARHDSRDQVVQVTVRGVGELEGAHANVIQSLVVDTEGLVGVLNKLVDGKSGVVGLNNGVGDLGGGDNGEGGHHTVGELLTDLGDQESTHTGTGTTTEGVGNLETLEAVAALSLATDNIDNLVNKFGTLGVVTLGPVVTSTGLAENEVVGTEELTEGTGTDGVHGTRLKINEDGTRDILVSAGLVEVDVHTLQLEIGGAIVNTGAVKAVLARDGLPESGTYLVTTLAGLKVNDLTHCGGDIGVVGRKRWV